MCTLSRWFQMQTLGCVGKSQVCYLTSFILHACDDRYICMSPQNSNVLCNLESFLIWFGGMPRNETQTHVLCQYVLGEGLASFQALTHPSIMEKQEGLVSFLTWAHKHGRKGLNCAWAKGALNSMKCEDILQVTYHTSTFWGTIVVHTMHWACSQLRNAVCLFCKQWRGGQGSGNKARAMLTIVYTLVNFKVSSIYDH